MEIKEKFTIMPDKSLYPKLGQANYTVAEALAELIDNSIDAREDKVNIDITIDLKKKIIKVKDNGRGMNKETAQTSIIWVGAKNSMHGFRQKIHNFNDNKR
jgi:HSP90 family molecular chaperone